ncbi:hypothetical protein HIM_06144 [Hirsutella minnesotensis 3608]|uniref:Uncharacterized protein n=1 Tax=Hirsutella minnesotensis 3608 TaxID=1043627 RepID=A0A0F7ZUB0_9HYPO|nr:hypothetical protein HIM_06144 [Hirsutella minnesotensis 3608]
MEKFKGFYKPVSVKRGKVQWEFTKNEAFRPEALQSPTKDGVGAAELAGSKARLENYLKQVIYEGDWGRFNAIWLCQAKAQKRAGICASGRKKCPQGPRAEFIKKSDELAERVFQKLAKDFDVDKFREQPLPSKLKVGSGTVLADALMMAPAWQLGLSIHILRSAIDLLLFDFPTYSIMP